MAKTSFKVGDTVMPNGRPDGPPPCLGPPHAHSGVITRISSTDEQGWINEQILWFRRDGLEVGGWYGSRYSLVAAAPEPRLSTGADFVFSAEPASPFHYSVRAVEFGTLDEALVFAEAEALDDIGAEVSVLQCVAIARATVPPPVVTVRRVEPAPAPITITWRR